MRLKKLEMHDIYGAGGEVKNGISVNMMRAGDEQRKTRRLRFGWSLELGGSGGGGNDNRRRDAVSRGEFANEGTIPARGLFAIPVGYAVSRGDFCIEGTRPARDWLERTQNYNTREREVSCTHKGLTIES